MQNNSFTPGDVAMARKLHDNTAKKVENFDSSQKYQVEGKIRPALVLGPLSEKREHQVCWFTSVKPEGFTQDFLCQGTEERSCKPRSFGSMLGFEKPSYLQIYPMDSCPSINMHESRVKSFPKEFLDNVVKACLHRMMQPGA